MSGAWDFPACAPCLRASRLPSISRPPERLACAGCGVESEIWSFTDSRPTRPDDPAWLDHKIEDLLEGRGRRRLSDIEAAVLRLLSGSHRGRDRAVTKADMLRRLPADCADERKFRAAVKSLVEDLGVPVGSQASPPHGYFLVETEAERRAAMEDLQSRIRSLAARVRALARAHEVEGGLFGT